MSPRTPSSCAFYLGALAMTLAGYLVHPALGCAVLGVFLFVLSIVLYFRAFDEEFAERIARAAVGVSAQGTQPAAESQRKNS